MKKFKLAETIIVMAMLVFSACGGGGGGGGSDDPDNPGDDPKNPVAPLEINGDTYTYNLHGGSKFNVMLTPDIATTKKFPCNVNQDSLYDNENEVANVPTRFIIGETEVTYQLWKEVYDWATSSDRGLKIYKFSNAGREGNDGIIGAEPTAAKSEPVTTVNWRDANVWCNALTEYYNEYNGSETDLKCVYYTDENYTTPLRASTDTGIDSTPGSQDNPYIYASSTGNTNIANCTAKGFRLPTTNEWEFAARYIGKTMPSHLNYVEKDGIYYTKGNSASGATADFNNAGATSAVAVYGVSSTAVVKTKASNTLGLYDMSGNVWEWCFTMDYEFDYFPIIRGGSYSNSEALVRLSLGYVSNNYAYVVNGNTGFRFCRTK
ncbi:MAG TPA: SUMF1/EgtB/PvdO family nonheme iron enzyme [Spirochaetota bacterium]|nr:SUMF1/EgtB/PvdO family nonheme iron enzyme [Spirochaetota bacterium]HQQ22931.1 SUMF1/EgtB/PvdO family nonheme iron enzyme [Spirochaetota bacterium]